MVFRTTDPGYKDPPPVAGLPPPSAPADPALLLPVNGRPRLRHFPGTPCKSRWARRLPGGRRDPENGAGANDIQAVHLPARQNSNCGLLSDPSDKEVGTPQ